MEANAVIAWFARWRRRNEDEPIKGVRERVFAYTAEARGAQQRPGRLAL
ncbi:MAG TPA: hypothetical protein VH063_19565 [Gaiellaceae bacterium]|nr:hypothetical protein [Gaiellaceae bacterium]